MTKKYFDFYITPAGLGGYRIVDEERRIKGYSEFVYAENTVKLARRHKMKYVHLAGNWHAYGKEGFGQKVTLAEANRLIKQRKIVRRN